MNILLINTAYLGGGAEKVTRQLFNGFDNTDIKMHLLCGRPDPKSANYDIIYDKKLPYFFSRLYGKVAPFRKYDPYATKRIIDAIGKYNIDIVHLQNIHGNYMGIQDVAEISKYCPVVWTLHDMWALTGHCAHPFECTKWIDGCCSNCPKPDVYPGIHSDVADDMLKVKKDSFVAKNITFVSPSNWLKNQFLNSYLKDETITVINNGIDTNFYVPLDRSTLRTKYNIPVNKHVLLFAASDLNSQFRSFPHLLAALKLINNKKDYSLVVLGNCSDEIEFDKDFDVYKMGYIKDEKVMNEMYSLSDVFITPSLADNFPCTTVEAFASGIPVIAFATGGLVEQIDSDTGILVPCGDSDSLSKAIMSIFEDSDKLASMNKACRKKAVELYSEEKMLASYSSLYHHILKEEM